MIKKISALQKGAEYLEKIENRIMKSVTKEDKNEYENESLLAFEELFRKYHGRLVLFANKFIGDMDISRDLVQDAFFILWEKSDQLNITQSKKAYLYQMVKNSCLNYQRHLSIKYNVESEIKDKIAEVERSIYSNTENPYVSLLELELEEKIDEIISNLPDKCRVVFELSRFEQLKNREIADKLGISIKMTEKHISKALTVLRRDLADYIGVVLASLLTNM